MDLQKVRWGAWIDLAQDRDSWRALVKAVMNVFLGKGSPLCCKYTSNLNKCKSSLYTALFVIDHKQHISAIKVLNAVYSAFK